MKLVGEENRKAAARRTAGPADERAQAAWHRFLDVMLAHKEQFMEALAQFELNPPQAFLLRALAPGAALPMCRIASVLACDASNVTNLVDRLEVRGLIERQPDPADRRVRNIVLTRSGSRLRQQVLQHAFAPPRPFLMLTHAELIQFEELLRKIIAARESSEDDDCPE